MATQQQLVKTLLDKHGRTFASELGADLAKNTPAPLFQLLCLALLTSAPVQADIAMQGARALIDAGWTTPQKMRDSRWQQRVAALNAAGYARVDEKTATQLAELVDTLQSEYGDDLRGVRQRADGDVHEARKALKVFKGIGAVGADIFLREVQTVWSEFYPFADKAALTAAGKLELPSDAQALSKLVDRKDFTRLVVALVRTQLAKDFDSVRRAVERRG
ncbi:hypothetical protein [Salinisphaera aquimarina]|uniref:Endonuclease n=1 Tax=Salinisphaera aquimarina TaxID=2094031 RepID=A0ABV7ELZ4_9GAMM